MFDMDIILPSAPPFPNLVPTASLSEAKNGTDEDSVPPAETRTHRPKEGWYQGWFISFT